MSKLFSPIKIKEIELRNRIVLSPMCQYSSTEGYANDWHLIHYGSRAAGGAGLIMCEATAVSPEGRISPGDLGLWDNKHIEGLKRITSFNHSMGAKSGIQLAHAGRKASHAIPKQGGKQLLPDKGGWVTYAPSALPFTNEEIPPVELNQKGIDFIVESFKQAAGRAHEAGFDVIEIHSAHGYLLNEFLSPYSNHRTDKYGGSFENRIRLLVEVVEAIRSVWPKEKPLFVRLSATEWIEGGWTLDDTIALAKILKAIGIDLIDCSSGGNAPHATIPLGPGYQVPFSKAVRKTGILTGTVGLITSADQAEQILIEDNADLIILGRELLRNPYFPLIESRKFKDDMPWPIQYERGKPN